jgi:hypothetical protein
MIGSQATRSREVKEGPSPGLSLKQGDRSLGNLRIDECLNAILAYWRGAQAWVNGGCAVRLACLAKLTKFAKNVGLRANI